MARQEVLKPRVSDSWLDLDRLEPVACNLCGADDAECFSTESRFNIPLRSVICRRCGLMYINPRMSHDQYRVFYRDVYRSFVRRTDSIETIFENEWRMGQEIFEFCQQHLLQAQSVIEIGCGPGGILGYFKSKGMEVCGIEPSIKESAFGQSKGIKIINKMLEEIDFSYSLSLSQDLIILSRSLNHFADPSVLLARVREFLRPQGLLLMKLLDFPAQCHYGLIRECAQADHLYEFCPETAQKILEKTGFRVMKLDCNQDACRGLGTLAGPPRYHMNILAQKEESIPLKKLSFPDYQVILGRVFRGQRMFFVRSLAYFSTYRHWLAVVIQKIFGERVFAICRSFKELKT